MPMMRLTQLTLLLLILCLHTDAASNSKKRKGRAGNFKSSGIKASKNGDLATAIKHFRKHIVAHPSDAGGYNNLGVALMRHGVEIDDINTLHQSEQAFLASVDISGSSPSTTENLKLVEQYLKDRGARSEGRGGGGGKSGSGGGSTSVEVGENGEILTAAEQRKNQHKVLRQRINSACQERQLRIKVRAQDHKAGQLSGKKLNKARHLLELCGMVILERLFQPEFTEKVRVAQDKVVDRFLDGVENDPSLTNSTWSEQRSPGRYELLSPMESPFTSEKLLRNPLLLPLMQRILSTQRIEVDTHSSVTSLGNTPAQHWHRDAGFIHSTVKDQLPPHGLVVFIPLVDVDVDMGPTMFLTGSHISCERNEQKEINLENWILEECPFVGPVVRTPAPKGSAIIFDLRILHRGLANKKDLRRPQLYVTFFQEWYVDHVNFNAKQSTEFDKLPKSLRKMLSRVDTKQYVLDLENKLLELGVDVDQLQSSYDYKKNSFAAEAMDTT